VTAGIGVNEGVRAFEAKHDDYSAIMFKALADRLAEAFTELLHERVRKEFWAYAPDEKLSNDELLARSTAASVPPGLPGVARSHREGAAVRPARGLRGRHDAPPRLRHVPAASVSGFYLSHPQARYFAVDKMARTRPPTMRGARR